MCSSCRVYGRLLGSWLRPIEAKKKPPNEWELLRPDGEMGEGGGSSYDFAGARKQFRPKNISVEMLTVAKG